MDINALVNGPVSGAANTNLPSTSSHEDRQHVMDRKELIDRLAISMRLKSGLDLPHGYFVEQVKLQLAGSPAFDRSLAEPESQPGKNAAIYQSAACFQAWAMRD